MGRGERDGRGHAGFERLLPATGADAPTIAGLKAGEVVFGRGGREVVARREAEGEEVSRDLDADGVAALVLRTRVTVAVAKKAGKGLKRARLERPAEDVERR